MKEMTKNTSDHDHLKNVVWEEISKNRKGNKFVSYKKKKLVPEVEEGMRKRQKKEADTVTWRRKCIGEIFNNKNRRR
jgi:hypothetical protein